MISQLLSGFLQANVSDYDTSLELTTRRRAVSSCAETWRLDLQSRISRIHGSAQAYATCLVRSAMKSSCVAFEAIALSQASLSDVSIYAPKDHSYREQYATRLHVTGGYQRQRSSRRVKLGVALSTDDFLNSRPPPASISHAA